MVLERRALLALAAAGLLRGRAAGASGDADPIAELIAQVKYGSTFKLRLHSAMLLARAAEDARDLRALPALAFASARDPHPTVRVLATQLLARNPGGDPAGEQARAALTRALGDPHPKVRAAAAAGLRTLGEAGRPGSTPAGSATPGAPGAGPAAGTLRIAIGKMGGHAPDPVREHMRRELLASLRGRRLASVAIEVTELTEGDSTPVAYIVDGTIKRLQVQARAGDVEADCAVDLVLSQPPRGILMVASGEALVQKPFRHGHGGLRTQMMQEAVSHAVRTAQENIEAFLRSRRG